MDMQTFLYGAYILVWPALTFGVLVYICRATWRDIKQAKKDNRDIV